MDSFSKGILPRVLILISGILLSTSWILTFYMYQYHREGILPIAIYLIIANILSFPLIITGIVLGSKWEDDVRNLDFLQFSYLHFIANAILLIIGMIFFEIFWLTFTAFILSTVLVIFYFYFYKPHYHQKLTKKSKIIIAILFVSGFILLIILQFTLFQ